jgi:hypothetical protein
MSTPAFNLGDHVRSKPRHGGWIDYMGTVSAIDLDHQMVQLHNAEAMWFRFDAVELVPRLDPTSRNNNGNASHY